MIARNIKTKEQLYQRTGKMENITFYKNSVIYSVVRSIRQSLIQVSPLPPFHLEIMERLICPANSSCSHVDKMAIGVTPIGSW